MDQFLVWPVEWYGGAGVRYFGCLGSDYGQASATLCSVVRRWCHGLCCIRRHCTRSTRQWKRSPSNVGRHRGLHYNDEFGRGTWLTKARNHKFIQKTKTSTFVQKRSGCSYQMDLSFTEMSDIIKFLGTRKIVSVIASTISRHPLRCLLKLTVPNQRLS